MTPIRQKKNPKKHSKQVELEDKDIYGDASGANESSPFFYYH